LVEVFLGQMAVAAKTRIKNPKPLAKAPVKTSGIDASEDADESAPADDVLLREAEQILSDYSDLLAGGKPSVVTRR